MKRFHHIKKYYTEELFPQMFPEGIVCHQEANLEERVYDSADNLFWGEQYPRGLDMGELIQKIQRKMNLKPCHFNTIKNDVLFGEIDKAYEGAYRSQYCADLLKHIQEYINRLRRNWEQYPGVEVRFIYREYIWDPERKQLTFKDRRKTDGFQLYEIGEIEICFTRKGIERLMKHEMKDYKDPDLSLSHELTYPDDFVDAVMGDYLKEYDLDDFDGRYGHFPDVDDNDVIDRFRDYQKLFPYKLQKTKQLKAWIRNRVPLHYRKPLMEIAP